MSSLPSLSVDFAEAAGHCLAFSSEIIHLVIADVVKTAIGVSAGAYIAHRLSERRTRKAILEGNFENDHAVFGFTEYLPAGIINPETGEEFRDQIIRTGHDNIELEKIFPPPLNITLMEYITKASKYCTEEDPLVFSHLDKIIKNPEELARTQEAIARCWTNYFSTILGGNLDRMKKRRNDRDRPVEEDSIPVLIREVGARVKQFKILFLDKANLEPGGLPHEKNVRIEIRKNEFVQDKDHYFMQRLRTNQRIREVLSTAENKWIVDFTTVGNPTGEYRAVPVPSLPEAAPV